MTEIVFHVPSLVIGAVAGAFLVFVFAMFVAKP